MVRAGLFNKVVICLLALVYLSSFVAASEISFETSQKDYYFLVGEDAVINLSVNNDYGRDIPGLFMYTIKESISNAGSVSTSQNSQSASFSFGNGISNLGIRLGTKQIPTDIGLSFKFSFEGKQVSLSGINAHFVANKDDKKNKQNKQSSSEQQNKQQQKSMNDKMKEMMDKMQQQSQSQKQPSTQQKISNSQSAQNGNELKQHMQSDAKEKEQKKQEFLKNLQNNEELKKANQDLMDKGFKQTGGELSPRENDTTSGDFKFNYKNAAGEQVNLSGKMDNNNLTEMKKTSSIEQKKLEELIRKDERFKSLNNNLLKKNFSEKRVSYDNVDNVSIARFNYTNELGEEASVVAEVRDDAVTKVYLDKDRNYFWLWSFLAVPMFLVSFYLLKKKRGVVSIDEPVIRRVKPFNYKAESRKLIKMAKKEFANENFKDAYGLANSGIRMFLSYKNGLDAELTNYEILKGVDNLPNKTKDIFDLCCLVEFAKYTPNKKDFNQIIDFAEKLIA